MTAETLVFDPPNSSTASMLTGRAIPRIRPPTASSIGFSADSCAHWLANRSAGGERQPLSLYFHIPFCSTICYYCACNKIITKDHGAIGQVFEVPGQGACAAKQVFCPTATGSSRNCTGAAARRPFSRTMRCAS